LRSWNFGGAGTLVVAPPSSLKGEFQSLLRFDFTNAPGLFNTNFGTNNWIITNASLELTSDYGVEGVQPNNPMFDVISGGRFVIEWLTDDGCVTCDTAARRELRCVFTLDARGTNGVGPAFRRRSAQPPSWSETRPSRSVPATGFRCPVPVASANHEYRTKWHRRTHAGTDVEPSEERQDDREDAAHS